MKDNQYIADEDDHSGARVWDVSEHDERGFPVIGPMLVTFDRVHVLNVFSDYPHNFTEEQRQILREERPEIAHLLRD